MNFVKDNRQIKQFPNKRRRQTINFFQTVREGRRTFNSLPGIIGPGESSGLRTPWICGRRFLKPTRTTTSSCKTVGTDVRTILSSEEQRCGLGSSATEDKFSNFLNELSESATKKKKLFTNGSWNFGDFTSTSSGPISSLPTLFSQAKAHVSSSVDEMPTSVAGSRVQHQILSNSRCPACSEQLSNISQQSTSFQRNSKKRPLFDAECSRSNINTTQTLSFFEDIAGSNTPENFKQEYYMQPTGSNCQRKQSSSNMGVFKKPKRKRDNENGGFFNESVRGSEKEHSKGELFKNPTVNSQKNNSNQRLFKTNDQFQRTIENERIYETPSVQSQKSNSNKESFIMQTMKPRQSTTLNEELDKSKKVQLPKPNSKEGSFRTPTIHQENIFSSECFFKTTKTSNQNSKQEFFDKTTLQLQKTNSNEAFFKTPTVQKLSSRKGIYKIATTYSQNSNQEFFNLPTTQSPQTNLNEGFFETLTVQPQKQNSNDTFFRSPIQPQNASSNEGFFQTSSMKTEQKSSGKEFFNTTPKQCQNPNAKKEFFKTPNMQSQKPISKDPSQGDFLKTPTVQLQKPISTKGFFKIPMIRSQKSASKEGFLTAIQTHKSNGRLFNTPSIQSLKTPTNQEFKTPTMQRKKVPSYDEFLKPQLNPQGFKISESDPSSSDNYESLFTTPSRVTTLPKLTTPHLFQPFEKPVSRTSATPASNTNSKTTTKTANVSNEDSAYYVMSVTEGRGCAVCEIGFAAIDLKHPELILSQLSDVPTYKKLMTKINLLDVAELLMPETFKNANPSEMYKKVTESFPDVRITTAKRVQFSAKNGLESVRQLMLPEDSSVEIIVYKKYYALAAAEALLKYIEVKHSILFSPKTLKIKFEGAKDVVAMDFETCKRLELVTSSASVIFPEKYSLFGLLNCTKTMGGKRRLRCNLMQPSCSQEQLQKRLTSVSVLVSKQASLTSLQTCLLKFSTVERLLWLCRKIPNFRNESTTFDTLTNYILLLKGSLESIPHLRKVLEDIDDDHIIDIRNELYDEYYDLMLIHIKKMIREDARLAKGYAASSKERCFAINEGVNDLLDLARATYSNLVEQVLKMVNELAEEYTMPLKMTHTTDMGFHATYVLPRKAPFNKDDVPEIFTEIKTKNRTVHLLTDDLFNLNVRINRAMEEIQLITNVVIYDLVESLKEGMSCLYRLCDRVAELDLLSCLAQVSSTPDYVKPLFGSRTFLVGARHPILDHICPTKPIPNNIMASRDSNFNIITGPNMSGKTVYVLTVPLIQIMAQVGCYVPADKAELRITNHIFLRKGAPDNMQCKLSSHGMEMKELSYTLKTLTNRSLIILDELCTNTTCQRGVCLAWAFCEEFLKVPAYTFLTTHYHYLCNLSKIYKNVRNYHMEAIERTPSPRETTWDLTFTHRLLPGITQMSDYALRLMMASALPDDVKHYALAVAEELKRRRDTSLPVCLVDDPATVKELAKIEKIENFMFNLKALCKTDKFTPQMIRTLQKMIREEILSEAESDDNSDDDADDWPSAIEEDTIVTEDATDEEEIGEEYRKMNENKTHTVQTAQLLIEEEQPEHHYGDYERCLGKGVACLVENKCGKFTELNDIQLSPNEEPNSEYANRNVECMGRERTEKFTDLNDTGLSPNELVDGDLGNNVGVLEKGIEGVRELNDNRLSPVIERSLQDVAEDSIDETAKYVEISETDKLKELNDFRQAQTENDHSELRYFTAENPSESDEYSEEFEDFEETEGSYASVSQTSSSDNSI